MLYSYMLSANIVHKLIVIISDLRLKWFQKLSLSLSNDMHILIKCLSFVLLYVCARVGLFSFICFFEYCVSLCRPGSSGTHRDLLDFASWMLRSELCAPIPVSGPLCALHVFGVQKMAPEPLGQQWQAAVSCLTGCSEPRPGPLRSSLPAETLKSQHIIILEIYQKPSECLPPSGTLGVFILL